MKKTVCLVLSLVMALGMALLVGCTKDEKPLKMGFGVYARVTAATDASEDKVGQGTLAFTAAVVAVDKNGRIVSCALDSADNTVRYNHEGQAIFEDAFPTKYEMGERYGMKAYGGALGEWFEEVDAFVSLVEGRTLDETRALVAQGGRGTQDVIAAGCTIAVDDLVRAIERAYQNATLSEATADHTLRLGISTEQTASDALGDKNGKSKLETTFFAAAVDKDGKIMAAQTDALEIEFSFDEKGAALTDTHRELRTKQAMGDDYGMKQYGAAGEWYEQANAFAAACIGKTAGEVTFLAASDGYGTPDIKNAGCTIRVSGFVKAAGKLP